MQTPEADGYSKCPIVGTENKKVSSVQLSQVDERPVTSNMLYAKLSAERRTSDGRSKLATFGNSRRAVSKKAEKFAKSRIWDNVPAGSTLNFDDTLISVLSSKYRIREISFCTENQLGPFSRLNMKLVDWSRV